MLHYQVLLLLLYHFTPTLSLHCLVVRPGTGLVSEKCPLNSVGCRMRIDDGLVEWYKYSRLYDRSHMSCILKGEYGSLVASSLTQHGDAELAEAAMHRDWCVKKQSGAIRCWCMGRNNCNTAKHIRKIYKAFAKGLREIETNSLDEARVDKTTHEEYVTTTENTFELIKDNFGHHPTQDETKIEEIAVKDKVIDRQNNNIPKEPLPKVRPDPSPQNWNPDPVNLVPHTVTIAQTAPPPSVTVMPIIYGSIAVGLDKDEDPLLLNQGFKILATSHSKQEKTDMETGKFDLHEFWLNNVNSKPTEASMEGRPSKNSETENLEKVTSSDLYSFKALEEVEKELGLKPNQKTIRPKTLAKNSAEDSTGGASLPADGVDEETFPAVSNSANEDPKEASYGRITIVGGVNYDNSSSTYSLKISLVGVSAFALTVVQIGYCI